MIILKCKSDVSLLFKTFQWLSTLFRKEIQSFYLGLQDLLWSGSCLDLLYMLFSSLCTHTSHHACSLLSGSLHFSYLFACDFLLWCLHGFASELLLGLCSDIISLRAPFFTLNIAHSLWSLIYPSVVYSSSLITWYNINVFTCMCIVSSPIIKASIWARDMCW